MRSIGCVRHAGELDPRQDSPLLHDRKTPGLLPLAGVVLLTVIGRGLHSPAGSPTSWWSNDDIISWTGRVFSCGDGQVERRMRLSSLGWELPAKSRENAVGTAPALVDSRG
jgi:hypothetical protein